VAIVESTYKFVESLNRPGKRDADTVKRYMLPLCTEIEKLPYGVSLPHISLSDFQVFESKGSPLDLEIDIQNGSDTVYEIFFDNFHLVVAVVGKQPQKCYLLSINKRQYLK
jgi:hypothetical protein